MGKVKLKIVAVNMGINEISLPRSENRLLVIEFTRPLSKLEMLGVVASVESAIQ